MKAGTWEPMVDAAEAAAHCRAMLAAGMSYRQQADITGISSRHVQDVARGEIRRLQPTTAEALLSLTPPPAWEATGNRNLVDGCGTRRRVTGLNVNGFTQTAIGKRLGVTPQAVSSWCSVTLVTRATAAKVAALADELYGFTGPAPDWARQRLVKRGWVPLEAWGDDIDHPAAKPNILDMDTYVDEVAVTQAVNGGRADADLTKAERTAAVLELAGRGMSDREIAIRLQWLDRNGKPAGVAVLKWRCRHNIPPGRTPIGGTATDNPEERAA